ncbi:MAG: cytochrome c1, partial [Polymorphobacter sp.]
MGRLIAFLSPFAIGGIFVMALLVGAFWPREAVTPDATKEFHREAKEVSFRSDGAFGTFDKAQLQRGFKVYREVCAACHGISQVAFRDLAALGFSPAEIKAIAKTNEQPSIDEKTGEATTRPGLASDKFYGPYPNEVAARAANNNALPPDLSLMTKAREHGNRYVYSLLTGYSTAPASWNVPKGLYYNP